MNARPKSVAAVLVLGILSVAAWAESPDQQQAALTRNAASGLSLSAQLSRNEYRFVERQETYTEQVPYDVQVPYDEDETYYENENRCSDQPRTRQVCHDEQRCEDVARTKQECHDEQACDNVTKYRQSCHNEQSCENVTRYRQSCHNEESCQNVPRQSCHTENVCQWDGHRNNCHGETRCQTEYDRQCSSRQVCNNEPYSERECSTHQACENEPYTERECSTRQACRDVPYTEHECRTQPVCHDEAYSEHVCEVVAVPHTRRVTKYRTVTQYRPEERVRTVTDKIFDHAWGLAVTVVLPPEATLMGDESESVMVALAGTEASPDAVVTVDSPIFSYQVVDKKLAANALTVTLGLVAKYAAGELGTQTVTGLALVNAGDGRFQVRFTDAGQAARVTTTYRVRVVNRTTNAAVFETQQAGALGVRDVVIPVTSPIAAEDDHTVTLDVAREGVVLAAPVSFEQSADELAQLDPAAFTDVNGVREFAVSGSGSGAALVFTDAGANPIVDSVYDITIQEKALGFLWQNTVARGVFHRAQLALAAPGDSPTRLALPLNAFPRLDARALDRLFGRGRRFLVRITVSRASERLAGHSPITIRKQADLRVADPGRRGD